MDRGGSSGRAAPPPTHASKTQIDDAPLFPRLGVIDARTKSTLAHHFSQSLGPIMRQGAFLRHITARSGCGRADAASRRRRITAPTQHAAPQHHGATASRHLHSTRHDSITASQHHGADAKTAACPRKFPRTRRFTAISSRFVSRATVSLRRSARSAGWQRLGVGCPRPRSGRPSTRVRPRPRRPAAARRRRRMG